MMKKIKSFIAVIAAMVLTANTVGAATIDKLKVVQNNVDNKAMATITVSGTSEDSYVSMAVVNPGMNEEDVDPTDSASVASIYQILKNVKVVDGKYTYTYTVWDAEGEYTLKVDNAGPKTISLMSYADLDDMYGTISSSTAPSEVVAEFEAAAEELAIDSLLSYEVNKQKLGAAIIADRPFSDVKEGTESYVENAVALIVANPANNSDDCVKLLALYEEELGLNEIASYDVYKAMSVADKRKVVAHVAAKNVTDLESFKEAFGEQIILTAIAEAESYGEVKTLLDEHTDIIDIDWEDELSGVKATSEIYKNLQGNYYASTEDLLEKVEALVVTQKRAESKSSGSSGSSGSVGVSGGDNTRVPSNQVTPAEDTVIFTDLDDVAWAKASIYALAQKKILSGMGEGIFVPNAVVTREQFVQGIVNAFGFMGGQDPGFVDVNKNDWFYHNVCIAYANGIISGLNEKYFGVGQVLTREEMATIVWRAMVKKGCTFASNQAAFADVDSISEWAKDAANAMYAEGIISGFPTGNFEPKSECTRAQMAVVLEKAIGKL